MSEIPSRRLLWKELGLRPEDIEAMDYREYSDTLQTLQMIAHREATP